MQKLFSSEEKQMLINDLILDIDVFFPRMCPPKDMGLAAYGRGDDWGAEKVNSTLSKPWYEINMDDISALGDDVRFHTRPKAFLYFLPIFLKTYLTTKDFGWFEETLLPVVKGYEDVIQQFSGGILCESEYGGGVSFETTWIQYKERVEYLKENLTPEQSKCVARYIEIASKYHETTIYLTRMQLLNKWIEFWLSPVLPHDSQVN